MPTLVDKDSAESTLNPILKTIGQCIDDAWLEWKTFYAPKHSILDSRARASIVFCHIADRAKVLFVDMPDVKVGTARGIFRVFIGDEIALRFKKAGKRGVTSNINTRQQQLIDMQFRIPGILPNMMLNAVYQLDDLQRDITNLMVTYQLDRKIKWSIQITPDATPLPIPVPAPAPPSRSADRSRVKGPKKEKKINSAE